MGKQVEMRFDSEMEETLVSIPVDIHTNVKITSIEIGDTYFDINFEDTLKRTIRHRVFEPAGKFPNKKKDGDMETPEEALQREERDKAAILSKLIKIYEAPPVKADDYQDYVEKCVKALTPRLSKVSVNLKVIYDSEFKFSRIPNWGFIEKYEEGVPPTLAYSAWELANRVNKPASTPGLSIDDLA